MTHPFDPGYASEPFLSLCADYPAADVYPAGQFRVEWGPIFHRGRHDGSARVLVIGQDPAQHETVVRRILVGEAGRRVQGLLAKLGIVSAVDAVIALGQAADEAWQAWLATTAAQGHSVAYAAVSHPTQPESASKGNRMKLAAATKKLLQNWNGALQALSPKIEHPDAPRPLVLYGDTWADGDRVEIPAFDFPAGLPAWMQKQDGWARRVGADALAKRRTISITVPKGWVA